MERPVALRIIAILHDMDAKLSGLPEVVGRIGDETERQTIRWNLAESLMILSAYIERPVFEKYPELNPEGQQTMLSSLEVFLSDLGREDRAEMLSRNTLAPEVNRYRYPREVFYLDKSLAARIVAALGSVARDINAMTELSQADVDEVEGRRLRRALGDYMGTYTSVEWPIFRHYPDLVPETDKS